jgi:hypothetical protein
VEIGAAIERRVDLGMRDASLLLLSRRMSILRQGSLVATVRREYIPSLRSMNAVQVLYRGQRTPTILARDGRLIGKEERRNIGH